MRGLRNVLSRESPALAYGGRKNSVTALAYGDWAHDKARDSPKYTTWTKKSTIAHAA
jgi:hypothetical protein